MPPMMKCGCLRSNFRDACLKFPMIKSMSTNFHNSHVGTRCFCTCVFTTYICQASNDAQIQHRYYLDGRVKRLSLGTPCPLCNVSFAFPRTIISGKRTPDLRLSNFTDGMDRSGTTCFKSGFLLFLFPSTAELFFVFYLVREHGRLCFLASALFS